jgi:hypothetical protein
MKLKRLWIPLAVGVFLYLGSYAYLRSQHVFIHRAGKYDFVDRFGERHFGRHFVQPGYGREGHEFFAIAISEADGTQDSEVIQERIKELSVQSELEMRTRRRLFLLYRPIAFVESISWYLVDPNPYDRPHTHGQAEQDADRKPDHGAS